MAENVGVSRSKLISTSASIRESNNEMDKQLNHILESVNALNNDWQSEASKNLRSIAANMQDKFETLHQEVETFAVWLDGAAANYATTEFDAEETAASIESMFK